MPNWSRRRAKRPTAARGCGRRSRACGSWEISQSSAQAAPGTEYARPFVRTVCTIFDAYVSNDETLRPSIVTECSRPRYQHRDGLFKIPAAEADQPCNYAQFDLDQRLDQRDVPDSPRLCMTVWFKARRQRPDRRNLMGRSFEASTARAEAGINFVAQKTVGFLPRFEPEGALDDEEKS